MAFHKKLVNPLSMTAIAAVLFIGSFSFGIFSNPITAKATIIVNPTPSPSPSPSPSPAAEYKDLGTLTMDLSKGSYSIHSEKYMQVYSNIYANRDNKRINTTTLKEKGEESGELLDLDKDGDYDVRIDYFNDDSPYDVYSKTATCDMTGTYTIKCTLDEVKDDHADIPVPVFPKSDSLVTEKAVYTTIVFKFTEEAPAVNTEQNTAVQEAKETIDESIKIPSLNKPSKTKKSIKISLKKPSKKALKNIDGFEIQCSTDKSFATIDKQTIAKKNKTSVSIKKLTPGKKYFVRVRAYKNVNGEKVYSNWSKLKNVKLPKK